MASAIPVLSKEESNFLRVANLLIKLSPTAVRILFDREFNPGGLKSIFSKNWTTLDKLKKKHVLTQTQWSLLFPSGSDPKSNNFDLTLMVCLLRNLTTITIQDHIPRPSDMSEGAAVSRIKFYRNQIAHSDSGTMSDADFNATFAAVSKAIEILCPTMKVDCSILQNADLDYSFHDIYVEFVKKEKQMEELTAQIETLNCERQNRESIQTEELSEWKKKLEKFYVTEAATRLIKVTKDNQCTIITGTPGSGKSSLAYYVAIHMHEKEGYTVLPIWLPSELIKMTNPNIKQLFVFDDVFGKYSLNEFNLNCWESETRHIQMLLKNETLKVIVTCRSYLYENVRDSLSSQSFKEFNLQSGKMNLSLSERKEISKLYLTDDVVGQLNDDVIMMYCFFPLLCVMFKENLMENVDFFKNPNQFIKNEIDNFKSRKDVSFIALALLVLSNNSIEKGGLQIGKDKYDKILQDLFDEMDTRKSLSKTSILSNLKNLKNTYLTETESIFCTKHDKIFDIICRNVGYFIIPCILIHGESSFISSRCQLTSLNEQHDDCTIMITDELETMYFERIMKDIEDGKNWEVFASNQMKFETYRNDLMGYLEKMSPKFTSSINDFSTPLHVTAAKGYYNVSKYLLRKNREHISSVDNFKRSPLHKASINGHHEIADLFLYSGAEINQIDIFGYTPLLASCYKGYFKTTQVLLKYHANINMCGKDGWYPLHLAADNGNTDHIKLLINHKAKVNKQMNNGMTPLFLTCCGGHLMAANLLIENKANVNKCDKEGRSSFHVACQLGFYDIVKVLIVNGADVNKLTTSGQTPLHNACRNNHINIAKVLLAHGAVINQGDEDEETPLHMVCQSGNKEIVELLCKLGASTNQRSKHGFTPLHCFCDRDYDKNNDQTITRSAFLYNVNDSGDMHLIPAHDSDKDIIKQLIKHGADVNAPSNDGMTPIFMACKQINVEAVKWLLHNEADANKFDNNGWSPLHIASSEGNEDIVNILLKHGVNIDHCSEKGFTSLHLVCSYRIKNIAEILIKNGAAVNKVDETGNTALLLACNKSYNEIAELLLENGADVNSPNIQGRASLYSAAKTGNTDLIKMLMIHDADVNFQTKTGMSPIYKACMNNRLEAVKMLCSYKADINKCEKSGWSPLHIASYFNHKEIVSYICEQSDAVINRTNKEGQSPLHFACKNDNEELVKLLLKHGLSIYHCDERGFTSFHTACYKGARNIAELLIEMGVAINQTDNSERTPLYIACQIGCIDVIKLLLKHGADVKKAGQFESEEGWTPLHVSAALGNTDIAKLLLQNKANVNVDDRKGHTPLYYASQNSCYDIVDLLESHGASTNSVQKISEMKGPKGRKHCLIQ
ncbi:serine/threonine-protein phosphatase 6 regulatory ankyrin repeat subunit B-like [Mytilus edulis]|uniref:serine/threonine-protein phosphatase 6 regulatory ankyrin repeat subunit B-like n=1 Tax=Mytilus edulis TaxID=6550 RepID=UPI0039EF4E3E